MCREELINFDRYKISDDGTIISKHFNKEIKGWVDDDGYLVNCLLLKNGKRQPYRKNRVIAYLFCKKPKHLEDVPYEELQVGHWDINRKNNNASNLYWCTCKENNNNPNTKEKQRKSQSGENNPMFGKKLSDERKRAISERSSKPVDRFTLDGEYIDTWKSAKYASDSLSICASNINMCCSNKIKSAGGFVWKRL